jgi:hypothetical protein
MVYGHRIEARRIAISFRTVEWYDIECHADDQCGTTRPQGKSAD